MIQNDSKHHPLLSLNSAPWRRLAIILIVLGSSTDAFAQNTCEDLFSASQTVYGVNRNLSRIYGIEINVLTDRKSPYLAQFDSRRGQSPTIEYSRGFKKRPATQQFAIALHETVHFSTYRSKDRHELTPILAGRGIAAYGTQITFYRKYYQFDEVEARLRELAALVLNAKKDRLAKREAEVLVKELNYHLNRQKALIQNVLRLVYEETVTLIDDNNEIVIENLNPEEERKFDTINIPLLELIWKKEDLEKYVQKILVLRLESLEVHRQAAAKIASRLERPRK